MDELCREDDQYVRDEMRWVVTLDNGEQVFADDNRPGLPSGRESAWVRLKDYCLANVRYITKMRLQFRSNYVDLPEGKDGYYFVKMSFGVWGAPESHNAYIAGVIEGDEVIVGRWTVPELTLLGTESRPPDPASPFLIVKPGAGSVPI